MSGPRPNVASVWEGLPCRAERFLLGEDEARSAYEHRIVLEGAPPTESLLVICT